MENRNGNWAKPKILVVFCFCSLTLGSLFSVLRTEYGVIFDTPPPKPNIFALGTHHLLMDASSFGATFSLPFCFMTWSRARGKNSNGARKVKHDP